MSEIAFIGAQIAAARPRAVAALLRYCRDLDLAEEAFQEASLRALRTWPEKGSPCDPLAWLILVGRNIFLDEMRRSKKLLALPDEELNSDLDDEEALIAARIDERDYRDDVLRLFFICCHPDLPANQQIALALRIVSGLSVKEIARAFLVGAGAMEQRITRAKRRISNADVPYGAPDADERARRFGVVAAMIYLLFNEGYSASGGERHIRAPLCEEAIRLARLMLQVFPSEPEIMGLTALLLLQHSRTKARLDADGAIVLLDDQDRTLWNRNLIAEGIVLIEKAQRHHCPGPFQIQAAIAAVHAAAARPEATDWAEIDQLYAALERIQPSPVVSLNRAVAVAKLRGAHAALDMIETLSEPLESYFYFHGLKGGLLQQAGRDTEARQSFARAIALANSAAEAAHIRLQLDKLG